MGFEMQGGLSLVEEGDDRFRLGYHLGCETSSFLFARGYYFDREFGPVSESTQMLAFGKKFGFAKTKSITAGIGLAILRESTKISYSETADQAFDFSDERYNGGFFAGIYWQTLFSKRVFFRLGWEAGLFPAGVTGGLFLATGRKQFFALETGVRI